MPVTASPPSPCLADVVEQVLLAVPDAPARRAVLMARHCRRELELAGAPASTAATTELAIARLRRARGRTRAQSAF